jgi:hypothetical protein
LFPIGVSAPNPVTTTLFKFIKEFRGEGKSKISII